jgi:hypothetical protein
MKTQASSVDPFPVIYQPPSKHAVQLELMTQAYESIPEILHSFPGLFDEPPADILNLGFSCLDRVPALDRKRLYSVDRSTESISNEEG